MGVDLGVSVEGPVGVGCGVVKGVGVGEVGDEGVSVTKIGILKGRVNVVPSKLTWPKTRKNVTCTCLCATTRFTTKQWFPYTLLYTPLFLKQLNN